MLPEAGGAVFGSLSFLAGVTPGRLFQMATRRSAGPAAASSACSCWAGEGPGARGDGGRSLLRRQGVFNETMLGLY